MGRIGGGRERGEGKKGGEDFNIDFELIEAQDDELGGKGNGEAGVGGGGWDKKKEKEIFY